MNDISNKYMYRVQWTTEDESYIGTVVEFPSLSWLADTPEHALKGIQAIVKEGIDILQTEQQNEQ